MESKMASQRISCPSCGNPTKRVSTVTIQSLLKPPFASEIIGDDHLDCESAGCKQINENIGWRYCDSKSCDVVYSSEKDGKSFTTSQLKVEVGVKESTGERPLCYCFGHSVSSIHRELQLSGNSVALDDIRAKMKTEGCSCETKNPSGTCCLGNVAKGIQIALIERESDDSKLTAARGIQAAKRRNESIAKVGTVVSAIIASSCCWLPLLLLAVGVSGAGIASTLEQYRPLFIVTTFTFLGAAFYFTYRPRTAGADADNCCTPQDGRCNPMSGRRLNLVAVNKITLWIVTLLAVTFLFFPSYVGAFLGGDGARVTANMNRAVISIEGMTCEGCAALVADTIRKVPSVQAVEVDYGASEAVVGTEVCCPVPTTAILTALENAGFSGQFEPQASSQSGNSESDDQKETPL